MSRLPTFNGFFLITFLLLSSCVVDRNLTYFQNINPLLDAEQKITNHVEPIIQPGDLLSITVNSLSPELNLVFNNGISLPNNGLLTNEATRKTGEGYLVNTDGTIDFPALREVKLGGLTRAKAAAKMTEQIAKYAKSPIVTIGFLNFRVTVLGEVNRPSSFIVPNEHVSILEALGLAGDMTIYGQRENVLVIREINGSRMVARLNLANRESLNSPYFYLQQNDVVYVEPNKARSVQATTRTTNLPIYISIASIVAILISSLVFRN